MGSVLHGVPMHVCGGPYSHWCYPCGRVCMCWGAGAWSANACVRWSVLALVLSMCVCVCPELQSGNAGAWSANACVRWSVLALVLSMQACVRVCVCACVLGAGAWSTNACVRWSVLALVL